MFRHCLTALLAALAFNAFAAVDVNKASQAELESVKGIGPGLSGRILEARKTSTFKDWSDMQQRVSGVGPGNSARLSQAGLTVGGQTYTSAPSDKPAKAPKAAKAAKAEKATKAGNSSMH